MLRKIQFLIFSLFSAFGYSQFVQINTTDHTAAQLVNDVLINNNCIIPTNSSGSAFNLPPSDHNVGYFTANGSDFPFSNGIVLRNGKVAGLTGPTNDNNLSTNVTNVGDPELAIALSSGQTVGSLTDAAFLKFEFVPQGNFISFDYIFASNEYGQYQCGFSDAFAIILTDLQTGVKKNLAVLPDTNIPVKVTNVRNDMYNGTCTSINPQYFDSYNVGDSNSAINMRGQTVPLIAASAVDPTHTYSLKFVIADYGDNQFDSAIFIKGSLPNTSVACADKIQLNAFLDSNGNGSKDENEMPFNKGSFTVQKNNEGEPTQLFGYNGSTFVLVENTTDTYDFMYAVDSEYTSYFTVATIPNDIVFSESGSNSYNIAVVNTTPFSDVSVNLIPLQQPRPGFSHENVLIYTNSGTAAASGTLTFTKDPLTTITSIFPSEIVPTSEGFTLEYTNLQPFETRTITITTDIPNIPIVALGNILTTQATITSSIIDLLSENNSDSVSQIIVGSYDPNDKFESHGGKIEITDFDTDDYLYYTIRFQNTGTASAFTVRIEDALDATLDANSVRMISASHEYQMQRKGSQLTWTFNDIHLPAEVENEALSHGYVHFKIKPAAGFTVGTIIPNGADIYFDNNPPIVTETFETEFRNTLSTPTFKNEKVSVFPNPAKNSISVQSKTNSVIENVTIIDAVGKTISIYGKETNFNAIDISALKSGIYLLKITDAVGNKSIKKLIVR